MKKWQVNQILLANLLVKTHFMLYSQPVIVEGKLKYLDAEKEETKPWHL
jgi:hypothetical protein